MNEENYEIEYLDEDEDLVQQCIQSAPILSSISNKDDSTLLVVRKDPAKRRFKEEEDSDYDPSEDLIPVKKKKTQRKPPQKVIRIDSELAASFVKRAQNIASTSKFGSQQQSKPVIQRKSTAKPVVIKEIRPGGIHTQKSIEETLKDRKKLDIRIPDYEDPLCLPVRAVVLDSMDKKKLDSWNKLCLNALKRGDQVLHVNGNEKTVQSSRSYVFSKALQKNGKMETTVSCNIFVKTETGRKKESYRSVLPCYREKKEPRDFNLQRQYTRRDKSRSTEVLLTKEVQNGEEYLVAFARKDAVAAVYKLEAREDKPPFITGQYLKELTCCKMCVKCYQASWRGDHKNLQKDNLKCVICGRSYVSVYNLLAHLKTHHTGVEVKKWQKELTKSLSSVVGYHYKCRICRLCFSSIKLLREHVLQHQGLEPFKCEVGNHTAYRGIHPRLM